MKASQLKKLFKAMLEIRSLEEYIVKKYPEQEMRCPVHLSIGQEAVAVGVCHALNKNDAVLSSHRAHAHYLAKGGDAYKMIAEIYGKQDGCAQGRSGSMYLIDKSVNFLGSIPIVGSSIPVATGVAWAQKLKGLKNHTVVFFGDAALEEGVFHESVNFAALHSLPILYVCENNLYSVYTHVHKRQPRRNIANLVKGHGVTVFRHDGNDVVKVYETTRKAIDLLNAKRGPIFLEFSTYRWREHCGVGFDNHIGYRSEAEFQKWKRKDPIKKLEKYLQTGKMMLLGETNRLQIKINSDLDLLFKKVKASPPANHKLSENTVYAD